MILQYTRKYFAFWLRVEKINGDKGVYHISFNDTVRGLCVFFYKVFIHVHIRIGTRKFWGRE